jgi:antitoxin VapB
MNRFPFFSHCEILAPVTPQRTANTAIQSGDHTVEHRRHMLAHACPVRAVRLPKEFRFDDSEVFIKKCGNVVQLIPRSDSWDSLFGSLKKFSSDFMSERIQPELDRGLSVCRW